MSSTIYFTPGFLMSNGWSSEELLLQKMEAASGSRANFTFLLSIPACRKNHTFSPIRNKKPLKTVWPDCKATKFEKID